MGTFTDNQSIKNICEAILSNSCVAFIGSGLSASARRSNGERLPTWNKLLEELVENKIQDSQMAAELKSMIEQKEFLIVAQEITDRISREELEKYLVSVFNDPALAPSANHMLIKDIGFKAVITSNYDRLIELAYESYDNKPPVYNQKDIQKHGELLYSGSKIFYILKNHGDIEQPDTIVLGTRDYNELFFKEPGYRRFLENIFLSNTVVFIGFGDDDPDITHMLMSNELLLPNWNDSKRHYILIDKSKVNTVKKNSLLKNKGIMVIEYDNSDKSYSQVGEFLEELKKQAAVVRKDKVAGINIPERVNEPDLKSIMLANSKKYYDTLRGSNGRFHHLDITDSLLTDINETFFDTRIRVNDSEQEIPLHSSIEKLWHSKYMHTVLVGEGGMGKTVSIIRLWEKYLEDKGSGTPVPIFLALNEYNNAQTDESDYILKMLGRYYQGKWEIDSNDKNRLWDLLRKPPEAGKPLLILFLDGFNEIAVDKRNLIIELNKLIEHATAVQLVITSRFDMRAVQNWNQINKLELSELNDRQIKEYIGEERFGKLANNTLLKVLRNPMLLTIYNSTCNYIKKSSSLYKFKTRVQTSGELLWNYFEGQRMKKHEMYSEENKRVLYDLLLKYLLPYIGYSMEKAGQFFFTENGLEQVINNAYERFASFDFLKINPGICENDEYLEIGSLNGNRRLKRFLRIKNLLCCDLAMMVVEEDGTYRFLHQNFRDYFAAVHILNEISICLSGKDNIPDVMKESPISLYVGKYMGEIEDEQYNIPAVDSENKCWSAGHYSDTLLVKLLERCRGLFDKSIGFTVWNILEIWKNVRGELTGADLSHLDLSNVILNAVKCSRLYGEKALAVSFENSILNQRDIFPQGHSGYVYSVEYSPDGRRILSVFSDDTIKEWDELTGNCIRTCKGHSGSIYSAKYSPDGKKVSATCGYTIKEWDVLTGECIRTYRGHSDWINSAKYSPDGKRLVSASNDNTIREWDELTGECIRIYQDSGYFESVNSAEYSPDGKRLVSASNDNTIGEWDVLTGECIRTYCDHFDFVNSAEYSPDGKRLVSASWDYTIKEWDVLTGECIRTYEGHYGYVKSAKYSPEGKKIVSASWDYTIKEWDVLTGECIRTYQGHSDRVKSAEYTKDGKRILSISFDNTIKEWDVSTGECIRSINVITGLMINGCSFKNLHSESDICEEAMALLKQYGAKEISIAMPGSR